MYYEEGQSAWSKVNRPVEQTEISGRVFQCNGNFFLQAALHPPTWVK